MRKIKRKFNNDDDLQLIINIKNNNCSESMSKLIEKHKDLFYDSVHRFNRRHNINYLGDLLEDLYLVFNQSVKSFNPDKKTKFSTWLSYMTRFHCLNTNRNKGPSISLENKDIDIINQSQNKYVTFKDNMVEINEYLFDILNQLEDKRISSIYRMRYIDGGDRNKLMTWDKISKKLGISVAHTINLSKKGKEFLYNKLTSDSIYDKV